MKFFVNLLNLVDSKPYKIVFSSDNTLLFHIYQNQLRYDPTTLLPIFATKTVQKWRCRRYLPIAYNGRIKFAPHARYTAGAQGHRRHRIASTKRLSLSHPL